MLADAMIGLTILAILGVVIATAMNWRQRSSERLADYRAATRAAERTLFELHQGQHPTAPDASAMVRVEPVADGQEIDGFRWVRVTAMCKRGVVTLVGLAKTEQ